MSNEQPRIVPDAPGWWWAEAFGGHLCPRRVIDTGRGLMVSVAGTGESVDSPDITWLAPIPGPEVCAALADVARELGEYDAGASTFGRLDNARTALTAAIRAERDGAP